MQQVREEARDGYRQLTIEENGCMLRAMVRYGSGPGEVFLWIGPISQRYAGASYFRVKPDAWTQLVGMVAQGKDHRVELSAEEGPKDVGQTEVDQSSLIDVLVARCALAEMKLQVAEQAAQAWREVADAYKGIHATREMESLKAMHAAAARQSGLRNEVETE